MPQWKNIGAKALAFSAILVWALVFPSLSFAEVDWFPKDVQRSLPQNQKLEPVEGLEGKGTTESTDDTQENPESDDTSSTPTKPSNTDVDPNSKPDLGETEDPVNLENLEDSENVEDEDIPQKMEGIEGPRPPVGVDFEPPDWLQAFLDWLDDLEFPDWTEEALRTLFWIVVGIVIVFALAGIIRAFLSSRRPHDLAPAENTLLSELAQRTQNRSAETHARQEDFSLAIHALLLDVLRELSPHYPIIRAPSATGREIALKIEDASDSPLYKLVLASEACVFAQSTVSEELFNSAKQWHAEVLQRVM